MSDECPQCGDNLDTVNVGGTEYLICTMCDYRKKISGDEADPGCCPQCGGDLEDEIADDGGVYWLCHLCDWKQLK